MSADVHCLNLDDLSAYLDHELTGPDRERVRAHLDDCETCRGEMRSLRGVVDQLHELERLQPPPLLEHTLRRQLRIGERKKPRWQELRFVGRLQSNLFAMFALVIALVCIVAWFNHVLKRTREQPMTTIVAPPPETTVPIMLPGEGPAGESQTEPERESESGAE